MKNPKVVRVTVATDDGELLANFRLGIFESLDDMDAACNVGELDEYDDAMLVADIEARQSYKLGLAADIMDELATALAVGRI